MVLQTAQTAPSPLTAKFFENGSASQSLLAVEIALPHLPFFSPFCASINESDLNNRQSLYRRAFKGETGLLELQDTGMLTLETLQILTRSEWVRKRV